MQLIKKKLASPRNLTCLFYLTLEKYFYGFYNTKSQTHSLKKKHGNYFQKSKQIIFTHFFHAMFSRKNNEFTLAILVFKKIN